MPGFALGDSGPLLCQPHLRVVAPGTGRWARNANGAPIAKRLQRLFAKHYAIMDCGDNPPLRSTSPLCFFPTTQKPLQQIQAVQEGQALSESGTCPGTADTALTLPIAAVSDL